MRWRKRQVDSITKHAQSLSDNEMAELSRMREEQNDLLLRAVALRIAGA